MWRYLAGAAGAMLLMTAGLFLYRSMASAEVDPLPPPPAKQALSQPLPEAAPSAPERSREEKRFDRYDKDRDDRITRDEYLASRRKAYAKLDSNGDGRLSFEEWAIKTTDKFAKADASGDRALTRAEFATTAVKRKAPTTVKCPPAERAPEPADEAAEG
ncbi:histidine kinase [Sphingomonas sp. CJ99]